MDAELVYTWAWTYQIAEHSTMLKLCSLEKSKKISESRDQYTIPLRIEAWVLIRNF